jgi:hypothetical protein
MVSSLVICPASDYSCIRVRQRRAHRWDRRGLPDGGQESFSGAYNEGPMSGRYFKPLSEFEIGSRQESLRHRGKSCNMRSSKGLYKAEHHERREGVNDNWIPCEKQGFWDGGSEAWTRRRKRTKSTGSTLAECTTGEAGRKHVCQQSIGEHRKGTKTSMFYIEFKEH